MDWDLKLFLRNLSEKYVWKKLSKIEHKRWKVTIQPVTRRTK